MIDRELLTSGAARFGVALDNRLIEQINTYCIFMLEYNEKVNLTAVTDPREATVKHFVDSLAVAGLCDLPRGASLVDVGTGAGFPGMVLHLLRPDLEVTLLDSLQKRLDFLAALSKRLGASPKLVHLRAEHAGADPAFRGRSDVAVSRAVTGMAALCEFCLPLVRPGGRMLAMKGPDCAAELHEAKGAIKLLGGGEPSVLPYALPGGGGRTLVTVPKRSPTPAKYPRQRVNIPKNPL